MSECEIVFFFIVFQDVVLAEKPTISEETDLLEPALLDELICQISTLASVYHKPPSAFVEGKVPVRRITLQPRAQPWVVTHTLSHSLYRAALNCITNYIYITVITFDVCVCCTVRQLRQLRRPRQKGAGQLHSRQLSSRVQGRNL